MTDMVNEPPHYKQGEIECKDAIKEALGRSGYINYCRGNAIKYIWRAPHKGNPEQDLNKAQFYLNEAIQTLKEIN
ncbi:MAG: hypothetical protein CMD38_07620 [Flavobacteriales bacterium]|nr:hypothetical protein [Flavobacteriales bacterium]|tara:strand:+ start:696 stop:920 length:225 start_codon:yes stop_codon:yes gene_type:complete